MDVIHSVGPYQIREELGRGAMGVVYLAHDSRLDRRVALKTLSEERSRRVDADARLMDEARAAASLNHPNVAAVYDVVRSDSGVHIVMEYVEGQSLADRLRAAPLPPDEAVELGWQMAEAVASAHERRVIHRDLKPSNMIVTPSGVLKILDFGLARIRAAEEDEPGAASLSSTGEAGELRVAGTPGYIAPERFGGGLPRDLEERLEFDKRAEIYSLGVTLFEMLTGQRPFPGRDIVALAVAARESPAPRVRDIRPGVPPRLDALVAEAMATDPRRRPASARALADALRALRLPTLTRTYWSLRLPVLPAMRRRLPAAAGTMALAAAVALGGWQWGRTRRETKPAAVVAVLPLSAASGGDERRDVAAGVADVLISTLGALPGVTMVSRNATLPYAGRDRPMTAIAADLGADLVVDGTVQKSGDTVRVSLSLLRPDSNHVAWSRTYDGSFHDLFTLQDEAATALAEALQITLTPEERARAVRPPTANVEALADYAQGRSFLERPDVRENVERSITLFQAAIAKDPRFARAHAGLGHAYWLRFLETRDQAWADKAFASTTESVRLDPDDAPAHTALAVVHAGRGRPNEAIDELGRAIALHPGNDEAYSLLGRLRCERGQREAGIAALRTAIGLRPNYWGHHYELGKAYFDAARYDEAAAAFGRVAELQPDSTRGFLMLGTTRHAAGDLAGAIREYRRAAAIAPDASVQTNLGVALYAARLYDEAVVAFEKAAELAPTAHTKHRNLGDVYRRLGREPDAQAAYERAVALCAERVRANPKDARALGMLAVTEAKLGRAADAVGHAEEAVRLGPRLGDVVYNQAVVFALLGRTEDGLAALERAFRAGFSRELAREDEDLESLRHRPAFTQLVAGMDRISRE